MAEYIEREAFLEQKRVQYCKDCARRKGMRNGKYKTLYEIGEAPCRACEVDDVLNDVEDFPAADVRPVVLCRDCIHCRKGKQSLECEHRYVWNSTNRLVNDDDFCSWGVKREMDGEEARRIKKQLALNGLGYPHDLPKREES